MRLCRDTIEDVTVALAEAHRALGTMFASETSKDFHDAAGEFLGTARTVRNLVARLGLEEFGDGLSSPADAQSQAKFDRWLADAIEPLLAHPLESLDADPAPPLKYVPRIDEVPVAKSRASTELGVMRSRPDGYYFQFMDTRPAIELCADYLERVTALADEAVQASQRL